MSRKKAPVCCGKPMKVYREYQCECCGKNREYGDWLSDLLKDAKEVDVRELMTRAQTTEFRCTSPTLPADADGEGQG